VRWHHAGNLTRKQSVFDDLASSAQFLIDSRHTSPAQLAILGGSNGGLLMGAALTQDPDLYRAVISYVGIYDMPRVELDPNGAFNVTEFGTVKDPEQFRLSTLTLPSTTSKTARHIPPFSSLPVKTITALIRWSPAKLTARLQAANLSDRPILLRTSSTSGHGMGTVLEESIQELPTSSAFSLLSSA
jgi:prolyl oligopeptidase